MNTTLNGVVAVPQGISLATLTVRLKGHEMVVTAGGRELAAARPALKPKCKPGTVSEVPFFRSSLQAYSVYDEDIGYCQGQSFLAAVLLLHVSNFPWNKRGDAAKVILFSTWFRSAFLFSIYLMEIARGISFLGCTFGEKVRDLMSGTGRLLDRIHFVG